MMTLRPVGSVLLVALSLFCSSCSTPFWPWGAPSKPSDEPDSPGKVDVALVLAIDNSGNVTPAEIAMQRDAYAAAFQSPEFLELIRKGPTGAIAVKLLFYSETVRSPGGWTVIDGPASAARVAKAVQSGPHAGSGRTHIAQALRAAAKELASCPFPHDAKVINVSGDGPDNEGIESIDLGSLLGMMTGQTATELPEKIETNAERLRSLAQSISRDGTTINCLAINDPAMETYFRRYVSAGRGSFTLYAPSFGSLKSVSQEKLIRELGQAIDLAKKKPTQKSKDGTGSVSELCSAAVLIRKLDVVELEGSAVVAARGQGASASAKISQRASGAARSAAAAYVQNLRKLAKSPGRAMTELDSFSYRDKERNDLLTGLKPVIGRHLNNARLGLAPSEDDALQDLQATRYVP